MSSTEENKENVDSDGKQDRTPRKAKSSKRDKNDPSRFQSGGTNFKAKLIGVEAVPEARGDKMCQEAMVKLKAAVKTSGEHKQKMVINVSLEGLKLLDEKTGTTLHHHAVHKISFISRDMSDNRAFGYVYGGGDGRHDFFGIKTEKAAEGLVLTLRDLFQVVFEMKKREMEEAKRRKGSTEKSPQDSSADNKSISSEQAAENLANDSNTTNTSGTSTVHNGPTSTQPVSGRKEDSRPGERDQGGAAVGNLLDLESELAFIQEGINQMDALPPQPDTPASNSIGLGEDPWKGQNAFSSMTTSPPQASAQATAAFPVNFNDAFQPQAADPFMTQGMGGMPNQVAAPTPPPRQSASPIANPFSSNGGSDMFRPSPQQSPAPAPATFRPSPQQSPQPGAWPQTNPAQSAQQAFPPSQAFPPQQDFPPQQNAFPAQQSFDSPAAAFPKQDLFSSATSSPFVNGPAQATSTPNQAASAFGQQPQQQAQQPAFGSTSSDPFKDDPFFSSSTPPTQNQDKYSAFSSADFSQTASSVFGDSPAFGNGSVFATTTPTSNGASAGSSTMNNAFGTSSPTPSGHSTHSASPTLQQQPNASAGNLFQDLDVLGGKKEPVDKSEFFKEPPKPSMAQLGVGTTPPPTMKAQTGFVSQPATASVPDPFGSGAVNVSETFNQPFSNRSLEDKTHDPFDTSNISVSPKTGPFDTSQLKPKPAESPPVQRSHQPNDLAFNTPAKNGAFEDSFTLPSPDAPPPPLPREASLDNYAAPTPPPRPTFSRAATIDMTSTTLPFDHGSQLRSSKFGRQATVDMGDLAPPPAVPPRPLDANPPALPPRPGTSASITSNTSSPVGTRRSSCTTPPLPPRPPMSSAPVVDAIDRHPSPQTTGSSASSSHEPSPHHPPQTAGTVPRARPRPRPRTPGSGTSSTSGSLTLTKLTEQPTPAEHEHMQEAFVRDTQIRQSDNTQVTARRLANKTLVRNQSEPMFSSSLPDGFRDSFRASPADFSAHSTSGSDAFPVSFPDVSSVRSQTPSEHSMDTDRVSESLTFDSARSHTDSPAFHSRSEPFPQDFDPFGDEQPKDPFSESPEEEVFTTKAITVDSDPFADPFGGDPFANDPFDNRPKSGSSLGKESNADTSSQYSDCRSTQESHSHSNSDSQAEAHSATLPKEALSHWESFSEKPTPTEGDKTVVDKFAAASASHSDTKDDSPNTNGLTEIRRDPFGSLDPLTSVDIKAKLQIKENLQIKEELQWAFSNKNQPPAEDSRDLSASGASQANQSEASVTAAPFPTNHSESTVSASPFQNDPNFATGPLDHATSVVSQSEVAQVPTEGQGQKEGWASDDAFYSSSQQPFAAVNGGGSVGMIQQPMAQTSPAFGQMAPPMQQQMAPPALPPRPPQSVGNPFAPNNQIYQAIVTNRINSWQKFET